MAAVLPGFPGLRTALSSVAVPPARAPPPPNPAAGLGRLPNELVIQVLASCPDFSTLWSLIRTSRALKALFDANAATVVEGLLQHAVPLPLAGILRAAVRTHLGTLPRDGPFDPPVDAAVWTQSPPFRRHEVPAGLLRNVVRLAHDIHVVVHLHLEESLERCAAMPREPPRWALGPPSAHEAFRVEMCLWHAVFIDPCHWNSNPVTEGTNWIRTQHRTTIWTEFLRFDMRPEYCSLGRIWESMGWEAWRPARPDESDGRAFTPAVGSLFPMQMPDPEPMARERYGSVWALLRRCTCCGAKVAAKRHQHLLSATATPSWDFYCRLLHSVWTFPSPYKVPGILGRMQGFGLPFWDGQRMVALGFPVRKATGDWRDYTTNFAALYTEDEFRMLAMAPGHRRHDSAEDIARENWSLSHIRDYRR